MKSQIQNNQKTNGGIVELLIPKGGLMIRSCQGLGGLL